MFNRLTCPDSQALHNFQTFPGIRALTIVWLKVLLEENSSEVFKNFGEKL